MTRQEFLKVCFAAAHAVSADRPALLPSVKQFRREAGTCALRAAIPVEIPSGAGLDEGAVALALGGVFKTVPVGGQGHALRLAIGDPRIPGNPRGAYRLAIDKDRIAITGASAEALMMGLRTVAQMGQSGPLPQCAIADWPDVAVRSAHVCYHLIRESLAYNRPNYEALLREIDSLAALKYNAVLLELESMFPYRRHPAIPCNIAFTPQQVRSIRDRLAAHRIEIVPMVQCLGHAYNVLIHDEYAAYREVPGTFQQYCPLNPDLPKLYMQFVDEYLEMFPGIRQWHLGGDESRQLGRCPRCKEKVERLGVSRLYVDHIAEIARRLHERGLVPMMWSDMLEQHPAALGLIPKYVKVVYWNYDLPKWPRPYAAGLFRQHGLQVVGAPGVRFGSPGTELSVFYPSALRGLETLIPRLKSEGTAEIIVTNWTKGSPHENAHYGFAYGADLCWNTGVTREDFQTRYARVAFGAPDASICRVYEILSLPLPYAEPVQSHMPDRLNRFDLSGLRFPEKWKHYTTPDREPEVLQQLRAGAAAGEEAAQLLHKLIPQCSRSKRQLELLQMSAECIRAKAEFGLALHEGRRIERSGDRAALPVWRADLSRIQAAWLAAKKKHYAVLLPTGFKPCITFLNELMFEPAEYECLESMAARLH